MKETVYLMLCSTLAILLAACAGEEQLERLSVKNFGTLADGREVQIYSLKNRQGSSIEIMDLGAVIVSLNTVDRDGNFDDITLGFDNPQQYSVPNPYFGALIGRYGNRIAGGKFTLNGVDYALAVNSGENAIHGGIIGFDKRIWQAAGSSNQEQPARHKNQETAMIVHRRFQS